jgi:beta-glucosidase
MVEGKVAGLTDPTKIIPLAHSYVFPYPTSRPVTEEDIEESDTDTCLYVLTRQAGEGLDRKPEKGDFYLTDAEEQDIALLARRYPKFILAVNVGGLVDFSFLDAIPGIDAIVLFVQGGEEGGNALADVLTGKRNFSGHLADTIPLSYADVPSARTFSDLDGDDQNDTYHEGIYVGYRYYDTFGKSVRFPFGFGLSYTTFSESCTGFSQIGDEVTVRVRVKNTGAVSGRQVIQLYLLLPQTEFRSETKRLAAFDKTKDLAPEGRRGEEAIPSASQTPRSTTRPAPPLSCSGAPTCSASGRTVGHLTPAAAFFLREHHIVLQCRSCCAPTGKIEELCPPKTSPLSLPEDIPLLPIREEEIPARTVRYEEPTVKESRADKAFLDSLTDKELVRLVIGGNLMQADPGSFEITGAGGKTPTCFAKKGLQNLCFSDGPAGINIAERVYLLPGGKEAPAAVPERYQWGILAHSLDRLKDQNLPIVYREATAWPVETLLAQSWDPGLLEEIGDATGEEMEAFGISVWLAPAMNLHRNPLGGRTFEYYSEDPLISGKLAAAITRGVQRRDGKFVCLKHFACNNGENNRNGISENVSERALRELYLKGFAIAVREGSARNAHDLLQHAQPHLHRKPPRPCLRHPALRVGGMRASL